MLDFDAIHETAKAQTEARSAEFWSVVGRLREEPQFKEAAETAFGVDIDVTSPEGIDRFLALVNNLGDKKAARVDEEVERLRVRDEAAKVFAAEKAGDRMALPMTNLRDLLNADIDPEQFVVEGLLHAGGNVLFSASRKTGKSTTVGNLIRSLVDGDDFLGAFPVHKRRKVVLVDLELSDATLQRWLREQGIQNVADVTVLPLRGKARAFNILDDATRAQIAQDLQGYDTIILDPLRPLADALGLNEHSEMGRLLEAFDALKAEAGISDGIIVHHHGHGSDRARGDSRLEDWPDALWRLTRDDVEDPRALRIFSAFGRDVDTAPGALKMDGRHLLFTGDLPAAKADRWGEKAVAYLTAHGESKTATLRDGIGLGVNQAADVLSSLVSSGVIEVRKAGPANFYSVPEKPF